MNNKKNLVEIHCKNNGVTKLYEAGTSLLEIYADLKPDMKQGVIVAKSNNVTKNLDFRVYKPKEIEFLGLESPSGQRAYIRSLTFIMYKAVREVLPGLRLRVEHPISGGYYCLLINADNKLVQPTAEQVKQLKVVMDRVIDQDLPFELDTISTEKALEIFRADKAFAKGALLESVGDVSAQLYSLDDVYDYYDSALAPSTSFITLYDLRLFHDGLLLQVPSASDSSVLEKFEEQDNLFNAFAEHAKWNELMKVSNVGDLNITTKPSKGQMQLTGGNAGLLITLAETLQEKKIDHIADMVVSDPKRKVVLIAGPSSSGKTTFSKKLSIHLAINGKNPIPFSMDEYFVNREDTPRDENGDYDFESVHAIDIPFFNQQLNQMLAGEEVELPRYNFGTGKREPSGKKIKLNDNSILVIEGIHGLNPELTAQIPEENKFRIYASALTTISIDDHNCIPTTDNRLLRRIVRDYNYRGYSAEDTINRWASVHRGEEKWIFPFQELADVMFNSALVFELPVLKRYAMPILSQVPQHSPAYSEAHRLLKFLGYFNMIADSDIPSTSLLREFFGGSSFNY